MDGNGVEMFDDEIAVRRVEKLVRVRMLLLCFFLELEALVFAFVLLLVLADLKNGIDR